MSELSPTEQALMHACAEISEALDFGGALFTPLSEAIENTGKQVDDLTVGELRQLIHQNHEEPTWVGLDLSTDYFNAGGTE